MSYQCKKRIHDRVVRCWRVRLGAEPGLRVARATRSDGFKKGQEIQMDASTVAGSVGTGVGVFLLVLILIGAASSLVIGTLYPRWVLPGPRPEGG